jgi:hypothetical protein
VLIPNPARAKSWRFSPFWQLAGSLPGLSDSDMGPAIGDILPLAVGYAAIMTVLLLVLGAKLIGDAIAALSS